jgi:hypothetical protein
VSALPEQTGITQVERPLDTLVGNVSPVAQAQAAQGATIEHLGAEIGRIAWDERLKTLETAAMKDETVYRSHIMDGIFNPVTGYSGTHGQDSIKGYEAAKEMVEQTRLKMASQMGSVHQQKLFMVNTQRPVQLALEHIDAHLARELKIERTSTFTGVINRAVEDAAQIVRAKAETPGYFDEGGKGLPIIAYAIMEAQKVGRQLGEELTPGNKTAIEDTEKKAAQGVVDSAMRMAEAMPNEVGGPLAQKLMDKFGDLLDPHSRMQRHEAILNKVHAADAKLLAQELIEKAGFRDLKDRKDVQGYDGRPNAVVAERLLDEAIKDNPKLGPALKEAYQKQKAEEWSRFNDRVKEKLGEVLAAGGITGQATAAVDWLQRYAPTELAAQDAQFKSRERADTAFDLRMQKESARHELSAVIRDSLELSPADFKKKYEDHTILTRHVDDPTKLSALGKDSELLRIAKRVVEDVTNPKSGRIKFGDATAAELFALTALSKPGGLKEGTKNWRDARAYIIEGLIRGHDARVITERAEAVTFIEDQLQSKGWFQGRKYQTEEDAVRKARSEESRVNMAEKERLAAEARERAAQKPSPKAAPKTAPKSAEKKITAYQYNGTNGSKDGATKRKPVYADGTVGAAEAIK